MHGLLPLQGKPTKNISNQLLSRGQTTCVCARAVTDQDYTFKLQPLIWEDVKISTIQGIPWLFKTGTEILGGFLHS